MTRADAKPQKRPRAKPKAPAKKTKIAACDAAEPKKRGPTSKYSEEIATEICKRLAYGETLSQICRSDHLPARTTVLDWVVENRSGFSDRYARARDLCIEAWADEIVEISDDGSNDWMVREGKDGETSYVLNGEHSSRSRLRVDSRKWLLSKLKPQTYGDKVQADVTGQFTWKQIILDSYKTDAQA
jgi:hypothetical protein